MGHIAPAAQLQSETGNTDAASMLTGVLSSVANNNNARNRCITPRIITQEQPSNRLCRPKRVSETSITMQQANDGKDYAASNGETQYAVQE